MGRLPTKPLGVKVAKENLYKYLAITMIYSLMIIIILLFGLLEKKVTIFISLFFEISAIYLLYVDEKFKMNKKSMKYGKYYSFLWEINRSPEMVKRYYTILRRYKKHKYKTDRKSFNLEVEIKATEIKENPETIEEKINSIQSDIMMLSDFSFLRKTAYILLALGFFMQFYYNFIN